MKKSDIIGAWKLCWVGPDPEAPRAGDEDRFQGILIYGPNGLMHASALTLDMHGSASMGGMLCPCFHYHPGSKPGRGRFDGGFCFSYQARFSLRPDRKDSRQGVLTHTLIASTYKAGVDEEKLVRPARFNSRGLLALLVNPGDPKEYWVWRRISPSVPPSNP